MWQTLGSIDPEKLTAAREQAHWAAQTIASAGETFCEPLPDTSQTALEWSPALPGLVGRALARADGARVGLRLDPFELVVLDAGDDPLATRPLVASTLAQAEAWVLDVLGPRLSGPVPGALTHPGYDLPPHPLAEGERFAPLPEDGAELGRWLANAHGLLLELRNSLPDPGAVLCWPHHFDIALLSTLARNHAGEAIATLGVGLSPGDEHHPAPYWYVNHWPVVNDAPLPPLPGGRWQREGWVGGVLPAAELVGAGDGAAQQGLARSFLAAAIEANRALVEDG